MNKLTGANFGKSIFIAGVIILISCANSMADNTSINSLRKKALESSSKKNYQEAIKFTEEALQIVEREEGKESLQAADLLLNIGLFLEAQGKFDLGAEYIGRSNRIKRKINPDGIPLGAQTEAFFDGVVKGKANKTVAPEDSIKLEPYYSTLNPKNGYIVSKNEQEVQRFAGPGAVCVYLDFNSDYKCDNHDLVIIKNLVGKCEDEHETFSANEVYADWDRDGCISQKDIKFINEYMVNYNKDSENNE